MSHKRFNILLALLLSISSAAYGEELMDYKKIGPKELISRAANDLTSDDVELRRSAADEIKQLVDREVPRLGVDPEAEKILSYIGDASSELFWFGRATSRVRAERILSEAIEAIAQSLASSDQPRVESSKRTLERFGSVLARNPEHPSSEKLLADLKRIFEGAKLPFDPKPAREVEAFLTDGEAVEAAKALQAATVARLDKESAAAKPAEEPPPAPAPAEPVAAEEKPASEPTAAKEAEPPPAAVEPAPIQVVTVKAPILSRQALEMEKPKELAAPKVISAPAPLPDDPAYKVTNVLAPEHVRLSLKKDTPTMLERSIEPASGSTTILNIVQDQLSSEDVQRQESGLKLTARISDLITGQAGKNDPQSLRILGRVRELLRHPSPSVRLQAVKAAASVRDRMAVANLIDLIGDQEEVVAKASVAALSTITGQSFGEDKAGWQKWAEENPAR